MKKFLYWLSMCPKYKFLIWRDKSGICFKFGVTYGYGCWDTIFPKRRPSYYIIPIFKKKEI